MARTLDYTYDNFNRLKRTSDNVTEVVYTYDVDGLRQSKMADGVTEQCVYDGDQLVLTIVPPITPFYTGVISTSGSANGTFGLVDGKRYYVEVNGAVYSAVAELAIEQVSAMAEGDQPEEPPAGPVDPPAGFGTFVTVKAGGLVITSADGGQNGFVEGPAGTTVKLYNADPHKATTAYIRGLGLIASRANESATYYHYDAHGNVVQTTTPYGAVIKDYTYDAFGVEQGADDTDANIFRYCGEQYDAETGNYYLRARYYTPGAGRFTQEDPAMDGLNWYAYCSGNPVAFVDPNGQKMLEPSFPNPVVDLLTDQSPMLFRSFSQAAISSKDAQVLANYLYNMQFSVSGLINGQELQPVSNFTYGMTTLGQSGCEVIANYNALILLDNPQDLNNVANWGENHGQILNGLFGTWPSSSAELFEHLGYSVRTERNSSKFDEKVSGADVCVFTFWNEKGNIFRGVHTVAVEPRENDIVVYNYYNNSPNPVYFDSFSSMISSLNIDPWVLYYIEK